jgi:CubicO group peptidase (beta-lactamase class C family)
MFRFVSRHLTLVAMAFIAVQLSVAQDAGNSPETEQRVERVTSGLTGDVVIKGEEHTTHTLADRMKELNVPGVSIAVIHEGKIEWARGFGVRSISGPP